MDWVERFQKKVWRGHRSECWPWTAGVNATGYGQFMLRDEDTGMWRPHLAHRIALSLIEPVPFKGAFCLHTCDNPPCCNPEHLRWGTQADNLREMRERGRGSCGPRHSAIMKEKAARGEGHGNAVLATDDVRCIRLDGRAHQEIADDYGISRANVSAIKAGTIWTHV